MVRSASLELSAMVLLPAFDRAETKAEPRNPLPPVINMFMVKLHLQENRIQHLCQLSVYC